MKSLLAPVHPGGPGKRAIKWLWWWWYCDYYYYYYIRLMAFFEDNVGKPSPERSGRAEGHLAAKTEW